MARKQINPEGLELEERIVQINRVSKVVKGGRRFSFSTMVVVGDGNGHVGIDAAKKNLIFVPLARTTVTHEMQAEFSATKVRLIPAAPGTGVIAGRGVRPVVEAAGIKDLLSKRYGSNNPVNVVKATFEALSQMKSNDQTAKERGLTRHELRQRRIVRSADKQES